MKRLAVIAPLLCSIILMGASSASAQGKPIRIPLDPFDFSFSAGQVCSFALEAESVVMREVETLWLNPDGSPNHAEVTGANVVRFTNLDNGKSVVLNESGPSTIEFNADGSLLITGRGATGISLFPTDTPPGPTTFVVYGRVVFTAGPSGVTILEVTGHYVDVCALIA